MSIPLTIDLIQAKNLTIGNGLTYAPTLANYPIGPLANLPVALTFPIQGQFIGFGGVEKQQRRKYRIYVYVAFVHQENYITAKTTSITILQAMGDFWASIANQVLDYGPTYNVTVNLDDQTDSGPLPDEGREPHTYAGNTQPYHGFFYDINVDELWGDNECP